MIKPIIISEALIPKIPLSHTSKKSLLNLKWKISKTLKFIKHGNIKLTNHDNKIYNFGSPHEELKVTIKINKPGLTYQIIKSGSVGLAEAYMKGDFETNNLSNLIAVSYTHLTLPTILLV